MINSAWDLRPSGLNRHHYGYCNNSEQRLTDEVDYMEMSVRVEYDEPRASGTCRSWDLGPVLGSGCAGNFVPNRSSHPAGWCAELATLLSTAHRILAMGSMPPVPTLKIMIERVWTSLTTSCYYATGHWSQPRPLGSPALSIRVKATRRPQPSVMGLLLPSLSGRQDQL